MKAETSVSIMVIYAVALHLAWATILQFEPQAVHATAVNALYRYIESVPVLSLVIAAAASLAFFAILSYRPWTLVLLLPQQVLLMMSAAGAIEAMWTAQFADGILRPRGFIAADQLYSVLAAIGHTWAIIRHALRSG